MPIQGKKRPYLEVFIIAMMIALSIIMPYMIMDKGLFLFFGDYDVEQVPFYMLAHEAIRSGNVLWSWTTDLGSSFISSYSFYLLGSPFFWLTIPLPQSLVPYTMGPLLILKLSVAAVTSFAYLSRFTKRNEFAAIGALLYAFSSYSIYDIFFNHFHDVMAFFPLLLIALEEYMINGRRGYFALTVFISALVNYNFFFGEVIFLIIYWVIRMLSHEWVLTPRKFAGLAFESVVGVGLSCVLLVPSVIALAGNYRIRQYLTGWNLLLYDNNQRLPDIIHSLFFPQDLPSRPNFFPDANNKWASIAAWLPLFSLSGALGFCFSKKGHWLRRILFVSLICAVIPGLNSMFYMFNSEYYARWFYMPVLMLSLATVLALEDPTVNFKSGILWAGGITLAFAIGIGLAPTVNGNKITLGLEQYPLRFWIYTGISVAGLAVTWYLIRKYGKNTVAFANAATIALTIAICVYGNYFITTGKTYGYSGDWFKTVAIEGKKQIQLEGSSFYRVDVLDGMDNQAMFWDLPTINAFQSTVSTSILDFYPTVGVTRDVASRPNINLPGIRSLFSVEYIFDEDHMSKLPIPGWVYYKDELGYKVWKNTNYIPMGFCFDSYVSNANYETAASRDRLLLKAIVLSPGQIAKYGNLLTELSDSKILDNSDSTFAADCADRRAESCSSFKTDNKGFTAEITLKKDNLVFFSVPYDKGWSATVNGKKADVEKVDVGFMAVKCPAGTSTIRFTYMTPGLKTGAALTLLSVIALIAYLLILRRYKPKKLPISSSNEAFLISENVDNDPDIEDN